ncbi:hypothetical protein GGI13_000374 [Coemansia sp. RSA 455]|nr:hypothetical protein GGI14_000899 [Coemansia sp. S680]KAJ2258821.1 hypothetical protein GGI13_000374 [Coemansia sp. RSA 455]
MYTPPSIPSTLAAGSGGIAKRRPQAPVPTGLSTARLLVVHYEGEAQHSEAPRSKPRETVKERKYPCTVCGKRFTRPSSLACHRRTHTGEKPHGCQFEGCDKHFSVQSNLRRHMRIHEKVRDSPAPRSKRAAKTATPASPASSPLVEPAASDCLQPMRTASHGLTPMSAILPSSASPAPNSALTPSPAYPSSLWQAAVAAGPMTAPIGPQHMFRAALDHRSPRFALQTEYTLSPPVTAISHNLAALQTDAKHFGFMPALYSMPMSAHLPPASYPDSHGLASAPTVPTSPYFAVNNTQQHMYSPVAAGLPMSLLFAPCSPAAMPPHMQNTYY